MSLSPNFQNGKAGYDLHFQQGVAGKHEANLEDKHGGKHGKHVNKGVNKEDRFSVFIKKIS